MKQTIYVFSDGELKRNNNTLYFDGDSTRKYMPIENVGEMMIFGEVTIGKKLLEFVSKNEILLHFFNYYGYYIGTYYPR
ncbi:MAG: CRISPR-associated endonuclease Cas1, partial [Candidatus Micrarchaeaceae archaeon]